MRHCALGIGLALWLPGAAVAACGGSFSGFVEGLKAEAVSRGHGAASVDRFFASVQKDDRTLRADRAQGVFRLPFTEFSRRVISQNRLTSGRRNAERHDAIFNRAEAEYGVPRGVLLAFWALETDFGAVQGDYNTLNSLVTLSHDCRRPELFRPQVFAALELFENGDFDPVSTTGAWAGEIGMVQMLPGDILERGVDGDGDGHVTLKTSVADALMSGARMLADFGWERGQPWLEEAVVPSEMDWSLSGLETRKSVAEWARLGVVPRGAAQPGSLQASLLLPEGHKGPAFLAFDNYRVFFEWNQSFTYVTTAAYFASRLNGAGVFDPRSPQAGLDDGQMKRLQERLAARGYDVGAVDGILGARTRAAVQAEQKRLGLPADAWPTAALLNAL